MQFTNVTAWKELANRGERLVAIEAAVCDRNYLLRQFLGWAQECQLPLYFWNPSCTHLEQVIQFCDRCQVQLATTDIELPSVLEDVVGRVRQILPSLEALDKAGIYIVEGVTEHLADEVIRFSLENLSFALNQAQAQKYLVFVGEAVQVPLPLHPLLPALAYPIPNRLEVREHISQFFWRECDQAQDEANLEVQRPIAQACVGLPRAEMDRLLQRGHGQSAEAIAEMILTYKRDKLRGRGITLLPEPDVPMAAGMDLLDETLEQIRLLLQPEAELRGLRPPKAVLLWGIPGTGKSLAAKLAAKRIGGTLIAADWNGLVGDTVAESMRNIDYLLQFIKEIGNGILFFDEFEKAFAGWDSGAEGGQLAKLAGRLLSWMNDHTEPVVMFAAINHLDMLPPEMVRRFEVIHFFGMSHAGALHDIFEVHLKKYFEYDFAIEDWYLLLREYRGCTPAEVMKAVLQVAGRRYVRDLRAGRFSPAKPRLSLEELIEERQNFVPDSAKRDVSNQIAGILNKASYAMPVQGEDTSIFAQSPQRLMGIDERLLPESEDSDRSNRLPQLKRRPAVEDI